MGLAGLILLGSYTARDGSESLTEYGSTSFCPYLPVMLHALSELVGLTSAHLPLIVPVLTLAGDLDGLTRITRIAEAYHEYQKVRAKSLVAVLWHMVDFPEHADLRWNSRSSSQWTSQRCS